MRLFAAVDIPAHIKKEMLSVSAGLSGIAGVSITPESNLHITVKFFGEADTSDAESLRAAVSAAAEVPAVPVVFSSLGCFPSIKNPGIIWAGVSSGADFLAAVHERLVNAVDRRRFPPDEKKFTAHATIARVKNPSSARSGIARFIADSRISAEYVPAGLSLVKSVLLPSGALYETIFFAPFAAHSKNL